MGILSDMAIRIDPALIFERAGLVADPWQAEFLRLRPERSLLNCCRQAGKSTTVASMACDEALNHDPSLSLILSPSERQSKETLRACTDILGSIVSDSDMESESVLKLELVNGSRIVALPGKQRNIRGFRNVSLLIVDEASQVDDALYYSARPMLAVSGGRLVALSTPYGKRGFFYKEWIEGKGWYRVEVKATQCPRITPAFLAEEKRTLPDNWYRQEYFCEFVDTDDAVFKYDDVQAAMSDDIEPLFDAPSLGLGEVEPMFTQ